MPQWPFVNREATLDEARRFIAELTRRDGESANHSIRRVRDHIRKARDRKKKARFDAPRDSSKRVGEKFWQWALAEWAALSGVEGFPHFLIGHLAGVASFGFTSCSGTLVGIPGDPVELRNAFVEKSNEVGRLTSEKAQLERQNRELEIELADAKAQLQAMRDRDAAIRKSKGRRSPGVKSGPHRH